MMLMLLHGHEDDNDVDAVVLSMQLLVMEVVRTMRRHVRTMTNLTITQSTSFQNFLIGISSHIFHQEVCRNALCEERTA